MKTKMHANVFKKKCLAAITAMLMAALLVVPANVKAVGEIPCTDKEKILSAGLLLSKDGNEDTDKKGIEVGRDENMTFVGTLDVKNITKNQMDSFEEEILKKHIRLTNFESEFKVTLTLKEGLKFKDKVETTLTGVSDLFEIAGTEIKGQTATITMNLKKDCATYDVWKEAVNAVEDDLKVSLTGVQFADNAKAGEPYEVTGTVTGSFYVLGDLASGETKCFNLNCTCTKAIAVKYAASAPAPAPTQVKPEVEIPYVPSDPVKPVVEEEAKVGKVAKTGEMANTVNQLGLIILAAASVVIAKKH